MDRGYALFKVRWKTNYENTLSFLKCCVEPQWAHFNETWHPHVDTILNTTPAGSIDRKMGDQSYTRPHDHKLRKYLSLKLDFEYLKFYWTHCLNNLQIRTNCTLKHIYKILVYEQKLY